MAASAPTLGSCCRADAPARIVHREAGSTRFVELFYPPQAILHGNGQPVCDTTDADLPMRAGSPRYPTDQAFDQALAVWSEFQPGAHLLAALT